MVKRNKNQVRIVAGLIAILAIGAFVVFQFTKQANLSKIDSYEACVLAGFPILESYPPKCQVPNGKSYTQDIGNELEYSSEFLLSNPRPNQKISSPLKVAGQARGMWYSEGTFSGELFDSNNESLGTFILTAQGTWMTEDLVPFKGVVKFETPTTKKGTLIIKNANPSGINENEKAITVPVMF